MRAGCATLVSIFEGSNASYSGTRTGYGETWRLVGRRRSRWWRPHVPSHGGEWGGGPVGAGDERRIGIVSMDESRQVYVIGGGPGGLAAAAELRRRGMHPVIL